MFSYVNVICRWQVFWLHSGCLHKLLRLAIEAFFLLIILFIDIIAHAWGIIPLRIRHGFIEEHFSGAHGCFPRVFCGQRIEGGHSLDFISDLKGVLSQDICCSSLNKGG